jgi:proline iminopeptidase
MSTPSAELEGNTTWDLVNDIELIRKHLGIRKWLVFGGSWGSTLALAYAIKNPTKVLGLILRGIFLVRKSEIDWLYQSGAHMIFPDAWQEYLNFIPEAERTDIVAAYYKRLTGEDAEERLKAAIIWSQWEAKTSRLIPDEQYVKAFEKPELALAFARIESHYFFNKGFFETDGFLLEHAPTLKDIPTFIVQGRYDVVCPIKSAWDLHQAMPWSQLRIIPDAGHSVWEPGILDAVIDAADAMREIKKYD